MSFKGTSSELHLLLDIIIGIEERYGIEITDVEATEITTLEDLLKLITKKHQKTPNNKIMVWENNDNGR